MIGEVVLDFMKFPILTEITPLNLLKLRFKILILTKLRSCVPISPEPRMEGGVAEFVFGIVEKELSRRGLCWNNNYAGLRIRLG